MGPIEWVLDRDEMGPAYYIYFHEMRQPDNLGPHKCLGVRPNQNSLLFLPLSLFSSSRANHVSGKSFYSIFLSNRKTAALRPWVLFSNRRDIPKKFYLGFCKQHLWPLFHYMLPMCPDHGDRFDRILWQAYVSANKIFADKGVSKGLVAEKVLSRMVNGGEPPDLVMCVGDDKSDEDMFQSILTSVSNPYLPVAPEIFACTVGRKPSKAKYYLDDTADVLKLLKGLATATISKPRCLPSMQVSFESNG
ncbi:hypothetical protein V6N13_134985 [Hibiscus sabdariffa]